jgi:hypothetical protein
LVGACGAWKDRAPLRIDGIPTPEAVTASLARFDQLHRAPDTVTDRAPKSVGVQSLTLRSHDGDPALDGAARDDLALSRPPPNASSPVTAMTRRSPQLAGTPSLPTSAAAKLRGACVRRTPSPSGPPSGTLEGADSLVRSGRSKNVGSAGSEKIGSAWPSTGLWLGERAAQNVLRGCGTMRATNRESVLPVSE